MRRHFAFVLSVGAASLPLSCLAQDAPDVWSERVPGILARIRAPDFAHVDTLRVQAALAVSLATSGADDPGVSDSRAAIQAALDSAYARGGGVVVLPRGHLRSDGPLELRSRVNLHVPAGTLLSFGWDSLDYRPLRLQRWEGTELYNWSPLLYARDAYDVAVTGGGEIHGNGAYWTAWRRRQKALRDRLRDMGRDRVPVERRVFGDGFLDRDGDGADDGYGDGRAYPLRPDLLQFYNCTGVLVEGVRFRESPFWTVHPVRCRNVTLRDVRVRGHFLNDDGIDPDSCEDVLVEDCHVDTVDDALAVKAGRDQDGWAGPPLRGLIVRRCTLRSTTNAWTIGSEMSGGVADVYVEDCLLTGAPAGAGRGHGITFKTNRDRGGYVRDVHVRRCRIDTAEQAGVVIRMDYHGYRGGQHPPTLADITVEDLTIGRVTDGPAFRFVGLPERPIARLRLRDVRVGPTAAPPVVEYVGLDAADVSIGGRPYAPQ